MTFASVKNAGFSVGRDQRIAYYEIYEAFLDGGRLPLKSKNLWYYDGLKNIKDDFKISLGFWLSLLIIDFWILL